MPWVEEGLWRSLLDCIHPKKMHAIFSFDDNSHCCSIVSFNQEGEPPRPRFSYFFLVIIFLLLVPGGDIWYGKVFKILWEVVDYTTVDAVVPVHKRSSCVCGVEYLGYWRDGPVWSPATNWIAWG